MEHSSNECSKSGCMVGGRLINNLMGAGDLVVLSARAKACSLTFNLTLKKSVMIVRPKEDQKLKCSFFLVIAF